MTDTKDKLNALCSHLKRTMNGISAYRVTGDSVELEPYHRERLDLFGNDGDGWDEEGWDAEYADPWYDRVEAALKTCEVSASISVDDKGFINLYLK